MVERGDSGGIVEAVRDSVCDLLLGGDDGVLDAQTGGDARCDRGGERAACPVDELVIDFARAQSRHGLTVEEDVDGIVPGQPRPALDDDVLRTLPMDDLRGLDHAFDGVDGVDPGQSGGLFEIRGDDGGQGHEVLDEEILEIDHGACALAHEHRIEDVRQIIGLQLFGEDQCRVDGAEHSGLDGGEFVHGQRRFELTGDDLGFDELEDVGESVIGIESDDAGDDGSAEGPVFVEHLQIGFESGSSGDIGSGDGEHLCGHSGPFR